MIPKEYIQEQNKVRETLKGVKDWKQKYWQEFGEGSKKWRTLRIQHLKRFKDLGVGNVMCYKPFQKEFIEWLETDTEPKLLYFVTENNHKWIKDNEKYSFDIKNIDYSMKPSIKSFKNAEKRGELSEGFNISMPKKSFWEKLFG